MTKRASAKYKIDRRHGENIWGRPKSPVNRREYGPGQHGQRRKGKVSDFGTQLRAKQKLKGYYGNISEKQFKNIYDEAIRRTGDTSEHLVGLLESRLDAIVYRAKFVPTVFAARQFVNHGHVKVNGKRVNIPSYRCKPGDVIEVKDASKQMALVLEATQLPERDVPDYIDADHNKMTRDLRARARRSPTCPIRCTWSRTWWSSSIRAEPRRPDTRNQKAAPGAAFFVAVWRLRSGQAVWPCGGATAMPFSVSSGCSSPAWNISRMMSQPPTNSPLT